MEPTSKRYVGYEVRIHAGVSHRGITSDPERRLEEHRRKLGPSAYMRILTSPMTLRVARQWESLQERTRGYHRPRRRAGKVWVPPHWRNGKIVRGYYRKA